MRTQDTLMIPIVRANGVLSGLFHAMQPYPVDEPYSTAWQPTPGSYDVDVVAIHGEYPDTMMPGSFPVWSYVGGKWQDSVQDAAVPGGYRPPNDGELFQRAVTARITALKTEVEAYIDQGIYPITRSMLRDGVLADAVADDVREFIALCYAEANQTIDAIEAVATIGEVDDPAAVWPIYGGAV